MRGNFAVVGGVVAGAVVGAVGTVWLTASSMRRQPREWAETILDDEPRLYVGKLGANLQLREPHENVDEGYVFGSEDGDSSFGTVGNGSSASGTDDGDDGETE